VLEPASVVGVGWVRNNKGFPLLWGGMTAGTLLGFEATP